MLVLSVFMVFVVLGLVVGGADGGRSALVSRTVSRTVGHGLVGFLGFASAKQAHAGSC
jgi:hypothetical protein